MAGERYFYVYYVDTYSSVVSSVHIMYDGVQCGAGQRRGIRSQHSKARPDRIRPTTISLLMS